MVLLGWWSAVGSFFAPLYFFIGWYMVTYPLFNWDSAYEPAVGYGEALVNSILWAALWSPAWYYFYKNWFLAILYWDQYLQEEHEEIIQFGEQDEEAGTDDLPEEDFESSTEVFEI